MGVRLPCVPGCELEENQVSARLTSERPHIKEASKMAYEQIIFDKSASVVTITFNRPDKLNSFTFKMPGSLVTYVVSYYYST